MWKTQAITQVGLALTEDCVQATVLTKQGKTLRCETAHSIPLNTHSCAHALVELRQAIAYQHQPTIVNIAYRNIMTKTLTVDLTLKDREIMLYLSTQSERLFGHPANTVHFDYDVTAQDSSTQTIRVTIAYQQHINKIKSLCETAGFKLKAIDTDHFALERAALFLLQKKETIGLVSIDKRSLLLCVLDQSGMIYATEAGYPNSEKRLKRSVIPTLQRALQFFSSTEPNRKITKLMLTGQGLSSVLERTIHQETGLATETAYLPWNPKQINLLATGLALWGISK